MAPRRRANRPRRRRKESELPVVSPGRSRSGAPGETVAAVCGLLLLADEFLPWYRAGDPARSVSAWQAFGVIDVLLALLAIGAIALAVVALRRASVALSVAGRVLVSLLGIVVAITLIVRLLAGSPGGLGHAHVSTEVWAWAGLALTLGLAASALAALRDEGLPRKGRAEPAAVPARSAPAP
ncbi:MAG: hypothetical protein ACR2K9_02640 [Solirubrobacteraceae bacterium]